MNQDGGKELTREKLYDKIWSVPTTQLAAELGISDVALGKRCKRLNVPKPPLGYWAKVAAGQKPEKTPLPPGPEPSKYEPLDAPFPKELPLPDDNQNLHLAAVELKVALRSASPDTEQRVKAEDKLLPRVTVSKVQIDRVAKALHAILTAAEERGITFRKSRSKYEPGYFEHGNDRLNLTIDEEVTPREPTLQEKRRSGWQWQKFADPSGKLSFTINTDRYSTRSEKRWTESEKLSLNELLAKVAMGICEHYIRLQKEHAEAVERNRRAAEEYERQRQAEAKRQHAANLEATMQTRADDLLKAAEWWRLYQTTLEFIGECERRWRKNQQNNLTAEQETWRTWAFEKAKALSPFETGYPNPAEDGSFDSAAVTFGGPYPSKRDFPRPPAMPKIPPPVQQSGYQSHYEPPPKPEFPFWLKHPRR